jgi:hypothetical protein
MHFDPYGQHFDALRLHKVRLMNATSAVPAELLNPGWSSRRHAATSTTLIVMQHAVSAKARCSGNMRRANISYW